MDRTYTVKSASVLEQALEQKVLPETIALAAICLIDTALTVWLVHKGIAVEANPLLRWSFEFGMAGFIFAKLLWFLPPLLIIESLRPRIGNFARLAIRAGIVGYMMIYVFGTLALHPQLLR